MEIAVTQTVNMNKQEAPARMVFTAMGKKPVTGEEIAWQVFQLTALMG
jgi:hypothetical protein